MPTSAIRWGEEFENQVTLDYPLMNVVTDREPREGSTRITGPSGVTDSWITGWDYILDCEARFIPDDEATGTTPVSGSASWQDFLSYGREGGELRFVPDVTFPDFWLPETYLVEPWRGFGTLTSNIKRQVALRLKNTGGYDFHAALRGLMLEYKGGGAPEYWTHTRTSAATYRNTSGVGVSAASGVLRDRHIDMGTTTTLLEAARTQLVTDPENFGNWTSTGTPVLTSGQADPFGGTAAYLIEDNDGGAEEYKRQTVTFTGDTAKGIAMFIRPNTASIEQRVILRDTTAATDRLHMRITWSSGVPTVTQTTGTQLRTPEVFSNGWYLFWWRSTSVTAANTNELQIKPAAATAAQTGSAYFFGANAWDVVFPASYQGPSLGTRSADSMSRLFVWAPQAIWLYCRFRARMIGDGSNNRRLWQLGKSDNTNPRLLAYVGTSSDYHIAHNNGATNVDIGSLTAPAIGDDVQLLALLNANGSIQLKQVLNGGSETATSISAANTLAASWSDPVFWLNSVGATSAGYNAFHHLKIGVGSTVTTNAAARIV